MAMATVVEDFGIDVVKDWLDIFDGDNVIRIENNQRSLKGFLKQYLPLVVSLLSLRTLIMS